MGSLLKRFNRGDRPEKEPLRERCPKSIPLKMTLSEKGIKMLNGIGVNPKLTKPK